MPTESKMTIERGLGENVIITIQNLIQRQVNTKTCVNCWHSKKDNSWNINIYKSVGPKATFFPLGKGWDFVDAVEKVRANYLIWASSELGLEETATTTFEIEQLLDAKDGVDRNDVGAIESSEPEDWQESNTKILNEIEDLKKSFEDVLNAVKTLKK